MKMFIRRVITFSAVARFNAARGLPWRCRSFPGEVSGIAGRLQARDLLIEMYHDHSRGLAAAAPGSGAAARDDMVQLESRILVLSAQRVACI
ncbi:hypothetical protein [Sphingosinicella sp. BN140058]|uniref:hypothetical protein n=1 Tax=Sphingosinicella sp. BN140058 TaxID=1892855 RepID=UPI0013EAD2A5|nr:hypothetical protein [Sphingosinicella sp. BN140058]